MYFTNQYIIDWEKVSTLEDLKRILQVADFTFEPNHKNLHQIQDLVKEVPKNIGNPASYTMD